LKIIYCKMKNEIPKIDLPVDFTVGDDVTISLLNNYGHFPCKIKAGLFVLCKEGNIRATINMKDFEITPGCLVVLPTNCFLQIHSINGNLHLYYAGFSSSFMSSVNYIKATVNILPALIESPVVKLTNSSISIYEDFFRLLIKVNRLPNIVSNPEIIRSTLNIFLQCISETYKKHCDWKELEANRENDIYKEFIQSVLANYVTEHTVTFYANQLNISLPHLCTTIRKVTGVTPMQIISSAIIMDAKAQLKSTEFSVKQIAYSLNFNNLSFFNKYFRQHVGMTPQQYRNS